MALSTDIKAGLNRGLAAFNVRVETLTAEVTEDARLQTLARKGHFERPIVPVLRQFVDCDPSRIFEEIAANERCFTRFAAGTDPTGFALNNDYYTSPDAEVLFALVQLYRPSRIVEVGSGNSTQLFRAALNEGGIAGNITSIDPCPRRDIGNYSDEIICHRVEELPDTAVFTLLSANDILFIDSSHEVKTGNDVVWLMLSVLPLLQRGVLIHFHDIFLPYEYPKAWVIRHRWAFNEQYLLQAFLFDNVEFETIWPGHYLEKSMPNFTAHFANWRGWAARSLWMRKRIDVPA